jgi:hypothetical protein
VRCGLRVGSVGVEILLEVGRGPLGFVLGVDMQDDQQDSLLEYGMVPVNFDQYGDIPPYLLRICQQAALDQ